MTSMDRHLARGLLIAIVTAALASFFGQGQLAQTTQLPKPTTHINDFARVLDEKKRSELEALLENVKQKTGIEFDVATVESTAGQDIFDFSRQLAIDWGVGSRAARKKSLLLVMSVNEKASFTQFSKSVQAELPEGVLGEMGQRMRAAVEAGQFTEALTVGLQHFVDALAQKLGNNPADFTQPIASATPSIAAASVDTPPARDAVVSAPNPAVTSEPRPTRPRRLAASAGDEAEAEEVELTLTLPLDQRTAKLKSFLSAHPDSKSRSRALELLVSARAALGDQKLKNGDIAGGVAELMQAIDDAPENPSDKLFSGVISQIPLNLFLRDQRVAAAKAAQNIEAKFGGDPKRLVALSAFYLTTEQTSEAARLATRATTLAPDSADAHLALGRAMHISLRLEEAAGEYKRALELDPNSKNAQRSVADLNRALGKSEEALTLYRQLLVADAKDKAARAGVVLSLLELGRTEEATTELDKALEADPRNVLLLSGAAYWFAAHNDAARAFSLANRAVNIEPRYTWSQVALARALVAQKNPLEAERALRFARQYGKFPTLDYELATVLVATGLYDEAAEILMQSFTLKGNEIEARLAGRAPSHASNFIEVLAPERRASIFQSAAADSESNARLLKALLTLNTALPREDGLPVNAQIALSAAKEFAAGEDATQVHRQLYAASRLLRAGVGLETAYELAEAARNTADAGLSVPAATVAIQAEELREIRARAIASGGTPDVPEAPRNVLSNLLRGRIEDISGWSLFQQDKLDDAVDHLRRAVNVLPAGTPALQNALWHLGAALERQDKKEEALGYYIKSYNAGSPDVVRRAVIEQLYRKINGSLEGLEERIGAASQSAVNAPMTASPEPTPAATPEVAANPAAEPSVSPSPEATNTPTPEASPAVAAPTPTPDVSSPAAAPSPSPSASPEAATPTPSPSPEATPAPSSRLDASPVDTMLKSRATVVIAGRIKDASDNPLSNVVVVLVSFQGSVLASTTDEKGNYSFTVASSTRSYRIIPSRDGYTFAPVDRVLSQASDDQKELDFVGSVSAKP